MRRRVGCVGVQSFLEMFQRLFETPALCVDLLERKMRLHHPRFQLQRFEEVLLRDLRFPGESGQITELVKGLGMVRIDLQFRF